MPTLTISQLYSDGNVLTAAMLDAICNSLTTFFNTTGVDSANIQTGGVITGNLANNAVTGQKFRQSVGTSVVGNSTGSTANVTDVTAASDNTVLQRLSGALSFATLSPSTIAAHSLTHDKLLQVNATSVLANPTGSTADYVDLQAASDHTVLARNSGVLAFSQVDGSMIATATVAQTNMAAKNSSATGYAISAGAGGDVTITTSTSTTNVIGTVTLSALTGLRPVLITLIPVSGTADAFIGYDSNGATGTNVALEAQLKLSDNTAAVYVAETRFNTNLAVSSAIVFVPPCMTWTVIPPASGSRTWQLDVGTSFTGSYSGTPKFIMRGCALSAVEL